jgi:glutamine synthetase
MSIMHRVARKHGFRVLLHEKPFAGVNGSGKHNNWSLGTDTGVGLLTPGKTPEDNLQFVTFLVNILMAVYKHNGLLKASIMTAQNAHRLGANEAPPAIISAFLGTQISAVLDKLEASTSEEAIMLDSKKRMRLGVARIPEVLVDNTDRNRTSPFAFTGNRFEFRAVGSSANCAGAMTTLNAAVAEQLIAFKADVDKELKAGKALNIAIMDTLKPIIKSIIDVVCFDGNGYTDEWKAEAKKRGLDTLTNVPEMFKSFTTPKAIELFTKLGGYSEKELEARNEVKWEIYTKKVQIEARVTGRMALNHIIPAALDYQTKLLKNIELMKQVYGDSYKDMAAVSMGFVTKISELVNKLKVQVDDMVNARKAANKIEGEYEKALAYHEIAESLFPLRKTIDKLEEVVDNDMWPLPKYRELLFIS